MKTSTLSSILAGVFLAPILTLSAAAVAPGVNRIANPGFELGDTNWSSFVPGESKDKGCTFTISAVNPHSGKACGELKSAEYARYSAGPRTVDGGPILAGQRCRLTFWIRADTQTLTRSAPGFLVRMILWGEDGKQLPGDEAIFVGVNGQVTTQSMAQRMDLSAYSELLPVKWTKVEVVLEVPDNLGPCKLGRPEFFAHYTLGSVFIDDISLERVPATVPLTGAK
ncbi:MAG: hypothetical protein WC205_12645 [Opitutaceae bacterium]|jgi:hypothetical protein